MRRSLLATTMASAALVGTMGLAAPAPAATTAPAGPAAVTAATAKATATAPIHRTIAGVGTFNGKFTPTHFTTHNGRLIAHGVVTGTLTRLSGKKVSVRQAVTAPVLRNAKNPAGQMVTPAATCSILDLTLGPLHLNLLGLVIDLNQVHLTITAIPGGGLLGNLLCSIANLLNGGNVGGLAALLNQLLGL